LHIKSDIQPRFEKIQSKTKAAIEKILKIQETNGIKIDFSNLDKIAFLFEIGTDEFFLASINEMELTAIVEDFQRRGLPYRYAKKLSNKPYEDIVKIFDNNKSADKLKDKIKKELKNKKHIFREHTDYIESVDSLNDVSSPVILGLINVMIDSLMIIRISAILELNSSRMKNPRKRADYIS